MSDLTKLLYTIKELNEIVTEIEVNDKLANDMVIDAEEWYTKLTMHENDKRFKYNSTSCQIITSISDNLLDLETYAIDEEVYDMQKTKNKEYYRDLLLTKRSFPNLCRDERLKKHIEYLNSINDK